MTTARPAVVTLCSTPRLAHVRNQLAAIDGATRIVVWVGDDPHPALDADHVLSVPPGDEGLRLAAARNAGASLAIDTGAPLLVFLDADCVPGTALLPRYLQAAERLPGAMLCGPVTYLSPDVDATDAAALVRATAPHPARPDPTDGAEQRATADEYRLFWSLSFAATPETWRRSGGFDEGYEGYGGEDTDFAFTLRAAGIPLAWVGGAHAYHQHHETSSPPWQHLDDILRNGERFAARWGEWPMSGWIDAFAAAGAVMWDGRTWRRT
ncbi:galactosyltransferase-related protein [Planococcus sp. APC 4015]|nr:galactosyltransferase-related protein [Planococcus sp. APC 4015]